MMSQCVEKSLCCAVLALVSVSLFYSRTVKCAETKLTPKLNKTQNLNFTHNEPLVYPVYRPCSGEHEGMCIHGLCSYPENINNTYCTCHHGFSGKRCEHRNLATGVNISFNLEDVIAIVCGVTFLLACMCVIGCCCYKKSYCSCTSLRGSKPASPYKNQENGV
ncbi:protransforming growth factor alpha [Tachysurus fulvidraco]|uniref:protransforming growth factor alpha n=1 Tax=Tachysurus fulvidraco TaxID=1234273 RepID=UPI000F511C47|nr:protransforming growth factor alpha [Tachysurus fulvidraco]